MFQRLSNLLFGSTNQTPEKMVHKSASPEPDDEGWLLVNSDEGEPSSEACEVQFKLVSSLSNTDVSVPSLINEESCAETEIPKVPVPRSNARVSQRLGSQTGALLKVTQVGRIQRAQARANHRTLGRNSLQRQNHTRQRLPQHYTRVHRVILHQPGRRNVSH